MTPEMIMVCVALGYTVGVIIASAYCGTFYPMPEWESLGGQDWRVPVVLFWPVVVVFLVAISPFVGMYKGSVRFFKLFKKEEDND